MKARERGRTDRWRMSGGDWVLTQILLGVGVVVTFVAYLGPRVLAWFSGDPLVVETTTGRAVAVRDLNLLPGASAELTGRLRWTLDGAGAGAWIVSLLPTLLTSALVVAGVVLVWRLGRSIRRGDAFGPSSLRTVRALAAIVLAYAIVVPFVWLASTFVVLASVQEAPQLELTLAPWSAAPFLVGMLLLVLAEAYAQGLRLRTDTDGLV